MEEITNLINFRNTIKKVIKTFKNSHEGLYEDYLEESLEDTLEIINSEIEYLSNS